MRLKKLVGLTGKTGAGKSTVSAYFKEKGAYIIDGDVVARNVFNIDKTLIDKLVDAFGNILNKALENDDVVMVDAAAIIESGVTSGCDSVIVVTAPVEIRKKRIMIRDSLSEENALIRINGQKDDGFYLSKADFVVDNDGDSDRLKAQLIKLEKEIFTVE